MRGVAASAVGRYNFARREKRAAIAAEEQGARFMGDPKANKDEKAAGGMPGGGDYGM